jgi:3-hydroxyisobutyrate dehydrogenase-like beta-hydroxyacid dehydrogenase
LAAVNESGFSAAHASPSVRRFARELGVDLSRVTGTGFKSRITEDDVKGFVKKALSGGAGAAAEGRLLVMVGGDVGSVKRCSPVFETFAGHIAHLGDVGAGQITKLINNLLFTAQLATASGALELAGNFGIDPGSLAGVLAHGSAASFALGLTGSLGGSARGMTRRGAELLQKDVRLVVDLAGGAEAVPAGLLGPADQALELMGRPR